MHPRLSRWLFVPTLAFRRLVSSVTGRPWWVRVDERLLMGAFPSARDVEALAALGVRGVVNLCGEHEGPRAAYAQLGLEELQLSVIDYKSPSEAQTAQALAFIGRHVAAGARVYVHCKAGRGRSATIALCWLIEREHISADEAMRKLRRVSPWIIAGIERREVVQRRAGGGVAPVGPTRDARDACDALAGAPAKG
jgi:atypical dual specificity phosphatase